MVAKIYKNKRNIFHLKQETYFIGMTSGILVGKYIRKKYFIYIYIYKIFILFL